MKRYTIFSLYMQGSNQSPQACHGLNVLWRKFVNGEMSSQAAELFKQWTNVEVEIMLQGGYHKDLEDLYVELSKIPAIPSAKFNESIEANNGACSLVTFVADSRIVAINNHIRMNRLTPANAFDSIIGKEVVMIKEDGEKTSFIPTESEVFVASKIAFLTLAK
jgi:hypothetical protein